MSALTSICEPNGIEVPHDDLSNVCLSANESGGIDITSLAQDLSTIGDASSD